MSGELAPVIAFDIFDTLVRRAINPEKVKLLALDWLRRRLPIDGIDANGLYRLRHRIEAELCRANAEIHGEVEFRFADMARALHQDLRTAGIDPVLSDPEDFVEALYHCELGVERCVLRQVPEVVAVLAAAKAAGRRVVLISDFYLPALRLHGLLADIGVPVTQDCIYVSCDQMASKRSGRIFSIVAEKLGVKPADIVMVGDNQHSDYAMARRAGFSSILVNAQANHAFYASPDADPSRWSNAERAFRAVVTGTTGSSAMSAVAPALLLFTERLYSQARRNGYRHLFFLAREGLLLKELFEAHQVILGVPDDMKIATHYLTVSRRASFVCSLRQLDEEDFAGLFANYRRISLSDFLGSLRFTSEDISTLSDELGVDATRPEDDFPTSDTFSRLRKLQRFRVIYERMRSEQHRNFLAYLDQFGVDLRKHPLVLVDVGWKGTIQDFIRAIVPLSVDVQGLYLGLLKAGQKTENKSGLLFSNTAGPTNGFFTYNENRSLFEILLYADHGSAHGYERGPDGRVRATLDDNADEAAFIRTYVKPVADSVVDAARALDRTRSLYCVSEMQWEKFVRRVHGGLVFCPWSLAAEWLVNARHRENFGVFETSTFGPGGSPSFSERLLFVLRLMRRPRFILLGSFWPSFTLYRYGGRALNACYTAYRRWQEYRLG